MRRNLITLFLAAALAAACNITDPVPEVRLTGDELGLEAVAAPPTKGFVEGTTLLDTPFDRVHSAMEDADKVPRTVVLSSWLYPQSGAGEDYLRDAVFAYDGGLWHHDPKVYWPLGARLDFLAYSSSLDLPSTAVSWHPDRCTARLTLQVDRRFTADDLMYAYAAPRAASSGTAVQMRFAHSQAWLQFALRATDGDVVTVDKVVLEDVYTSGALTVEPDGAAARGAWDFSCETGGDLAVEDAAGNTRFGLGAAAQHLDVLLPQQPQKDIVIWYHLSGSDRQLRYRVEAPVAHWVAGNRYAYAVTVRGTAVTVGATVEPWDTVTVDTSDNEIRGTGSAVDRIGEDFNFSASSRILWRAPDEEDYVTLTDGTGTWGDSVEFTCGDYVVTLKETPAGTYAFSYRRDYEHEYFTVEALEDGTVSLVTSTNSYLYANEYYSINNGEWVKITFPQGDGTSVSVSAGDRVRYKGNLDNNRDGMYYYFRFSNRVAVYGNIMSLKHGDDFYGKDLVEDSQARYSYTFRSLFSGCGTLVSAKNLVLPNTTNTGCYREMFRACTSLVEMPVMRATVLYDACYEDMFQGCTSLTSMPALPDGIAEIPTNAFHKMFMNCTSLSDVPDVLPTSTVGANGYDSMFYGCTALQEAPRLPATTLGSGAYKAMFYRCTALQEAPELPCLDLAGKTAVYGSMFAGCTSLTSTCELPAMEVPSNGYEGMFSGCTSLTSTCELPATTIGYKSYASMFEGCTALRTTTATLPAQKVHTQSYYSMYRSCHSLLRGPEILADEIVTVSGEGLGNTFAYMFFQCDAMTECTSEIRVREFEDASMAFTFFGCTSLVTGPKVHCDSLKWDNANYNTDIFKDTFANCSAMTSCDFRYAPDVVYRGALQETFFGCYRLEDFPEEDFVRFSKVYQRGCRMTFYNCSSLTRFPDLTITAVDGNATNTNSSVTVPYYSSYSSYWDFGSTSAVNQHFAYMLAGTKITSPGLDLSALDAVYSCMFYGMYSGCTELTAAPVMSAVTVKPGGCSYMFYGCSKMASSPQGLEITSVDRYGCSYMFYGCTLMADAPVLSFMNVPDWACYQMFYGCQSLTAAPALPFTTVDNRGCFEMFRGCGLTACPEIHVTTVGTLALDGMFHSCGSMTTPCPILPAMTLAGNCYDSMFRGCRSLVSAPVLPALTMASSCYANMFSDCEALASAPALPATSLAASCYQYMFYGCASLTAAPDLMAETLVNNCYYGMFYYCRNITSVKMMATNWVANSHTYNWLMYGSSSGTFTKSAAQTSVTRSTSGVPAGWTIVDM